MRYLSINIAAFHVQFSEDFSALGNPLEEEGTCLGLVCDAKAAGLLRTWCVD